MTNLAFELFFSKKKLAAKGFGQPPTRLGWGSLIFGEHPMDHIQPIFSQIG